MPSSSDCWGIEVGANAIKALRLRRSGDGVSVADFEVLPFKKVLTTPDLDAEEAIRVGLDQLLQRHEIGKAPVMVSVPGHMAFARFAKLPPVEPKQIPKIVEFEARQQIPFPIEQVEWDYQTFQDPDSPDVEVGIFAITKERLIPWLQNFQAVGLGVRSIVLSPVAAFNAMLYDRDLADADRGTILMDIGTSATDLIITERGRVWLRTIPIGGNHFTEALVRSFKLSFSKAEKLKREATTSKYSRQIFNAMRPVYVDLVQEVQKSLGYYQSLNRDSDLGKLVGLGSTFRLPGLPTFLKQQLQIDVNRLDAFRKLEVQGRDASQFADNVLSLAPAYGLALQGLELEAVGCNLLQAPVIRRQVWKSKQPMFVAAAAVAVAAAGLAFASTYIAQSRFNAGGNQAERQQADRVLAKAKSQYSAWQNLQSASGADPRKRIGNINSTLEYRSVWPGLVRDIDNAMMALDPQPALFSGDPEKIKAIPRNERRIVFLDELTATYSYVPPVEGQTEPTTDPETGRWVDTEPAPQIRVQVTGTTPYHTPEQSAAAFVEAGFQQYLESLGDRPGVAYRIVPGSVRVTNSAEVGSELAPGQTEPSAPGYGPGGIPGGGGPNFGAIPGGNTGIPGGGYGGYDGYGPGPGGPDYGGPDFGGPDFGAGGGNIASGSFQDFFNRALPQPILADESRVGDRRFTLEFRVQIRSIADANAPVAGPADAPEPIPAGPQALSPDAAGGAQENAS